MLVESIEECVRSHFLPGTRNFLCRQCRHSFPEPGSSIGSFHSALRLSFSRRASCALTRHCVLFLPIKEIIAGCSQAPPRQ